MENETREAYSPTDVADAVASLERLDAANLLLLRDEIDRICRQKGIYADGRGRRRVMLGAP